MQSTEVSKLAPPAPDKITFSIQPVEPSTSKTVKTPDPAGTYEPENEKPRTVPFPVETVKPASAAAPPLAPKRLPSPE